MKRGKIILTIENKINELEILKSNAIQNNGLDIINEIYNTSINCYSDCLKMLRSEPTKTECKNAVKYLIVDDKEDLIRMIKAIKENKDQNELIDYIDCVQVWEKAELEFTCKEFLEIIK